MRLPLTTAAPTMAYACHCTDCQHLTSSAFSVAITVPDGGFRLTKGAPRRLQKTADSGRVIARWVCPDCACWVTSDPQPGTATGDAIRRVRAGTLDDTSWLRPTAHYWTRSKQAWVALPEGDQVFETQPW